MDESTDGRVIGIVKQGIIGMFIYLQTKNVKDYIGFIRLVGISLLIYKL